MGLLLSVLVVCVGVLEAIACASHVRLGWVAEGVRRGLQHHPNAHEHSRRKPNDLEDEGDSDESSDELSRILLPHNGGGNIERSYGLTPILTEHRRKTPILHDDEEDEVEEVPPKYVVANNIDECYTGSCRDNVVTEHFRPISPSDNPEQPVDESYVSQTGKFLEIPPDGSSPMQRSSSEETLHDSETEDVRSSSSAPRDVSFQIDASSPPPQDGVGRHDAVFDLVSAAAHILSSEANTERRSPLPLGASTSSCRPLSVDVTARIPTPQAHRESIPFDLAAAHASSSSRPDTPSTPRKSRVADISWPVFHPEPVIKRPVLELAARGDSIEEDLDVELDTSLPTQSPHVLVARGDGNEEDLDVELDPSLRPQSPHVLVARGDGNVEDPDNTCLRSQSPHVLAEAGDSIKEDLEDLSLVSHSPHVLAEGGDSIKEDLEDLSLVSHSPHVLAEGGDSIKEDLLDPSLNVDVDVDPSLPPHSSDVALDVAKLNECREVEDQCSKVVARSLSATPFMSIPGGGVGGRVAVSPQHRNDVADAPRCRKTSVDRFGRITCEPRRKRRGSLERRAEGTLKDSLVMSKSLPDFFFEENANKKKDVEGVATPDDGGVSLGKDITPKESSIKRRRSYREKKRSNWTPTKSRSRDVVEPLSETETTDDDKTPANTKKSLFEIDNETMEEFVGSPADSEAKAIVNSALTPVEVLHHSEVRPESGVFATPTQQPKTRLKKPVKAESFEEAGPASGHARASDIATPTHHPVKVKEAGPTSRHAPVETLATAPPTADNNPPPPLARPTREPASNTDETIANNDDDDDDDVSASESDTSNINQPQQSSEPAPFWLIFSGEYTKAMSKDWHSGHFCCWQCDESLTGQRYVLRDDHPYCIKCYESVFANMCEECSKTIGIDSKDLSYKDKHWHEACFLCNKCRVSLVDKQFGSKADKIYCSNCYDAQFASRCDGCGEIFRAGTKKMEYKTRQWHEKCFCCCVCKSAIGTKSFIPREQEIYCATCYEEKFATRCVKCNKIITSGGVTYKNEPWHRECFTCTHCNTSLAGQRFTSRDEKPYCAECFGELFAKRCTACVKPITGIGGTRFISFEDRHWHNDCFICASCKTSLVGRGFITDAEDIICPECAKQKLM